MEYIESNFVHLHQKYKEKYKESTKTMNDIMMRYVFDRLNKADDSRNTGLLQIEVRKKGTADKKLISTGIHLFKNQFSDKNGFTCKNHPSSTSITGRVRKMYREIEDFVYSDKCKSLDDVKYWNKERTNTGSFISFCREELRKSDPSDAKIEHHNSLFRRIEDFGKMNLFKDINYPNLIEFDMYLRKFIQSSPTMYKRHSTLKHYIDKAVYHGHIERNPYLEFKMPIKKGKDPTFLVEDEISKILKYTPNTERMQKVKDMFVFQMFTGLAYIDLQNFSIEYISELDGYKVITNERVKTKETFFSLFLSEAESIAEKYDYSFPKISNQKYNDYLKLLGEGAGIKKNITSHVGRHTYATYLLNKDIPLNTVSKAMGHSSIKMTEHYAKLLGKTIVNDMKKLINSERKD